MFKLIKKDLILGSTLGKNSLSINFLMLLIFGGVMFKISILDIWLMIIIVYIAIIVISPIIVEDKLKTDSLAASMPIKRSTIINSKYLFAILAIITIVVFMLSYGYVLDMFINANYIDYLNAFTFSRVFSMVFISVIIVSFLIPLVLKFGQNGMMIAMAASMLLSTTFFIITAIGLKSTALNKILGGFFEMIEGGGISNFFLSISSSLGAPLALAVLIGAMAIMVFISIRISLFVYIRKEF